MADDGDFGYEDKNLDRNIDNDGYDDDYDKQEAYRTQPFQPGAASTPYQGEQYEMQTMQNEQSRHPDTSYEEPFVGRASSNPKMGWDALTRFFPEASSTDLETTYSKTGRLQVKMARFEKKTLRSFHQK